jgi:putative ABC transport system permease protein
MRLKLFMLSSYLKTAIRNIRCHRAHSFLNITGLAVGMACTIIILLWVRYECSFDRYHENASSIYRLITDFHFGTFQGKYAVSNNAPGPTLERDYPEVAKAVRFHPVWGISTVSYKERKFVQRGMFYADNTVFEVFTLPLLSGNTDSALTAAYSVVITKEMATKYFGREDPLGKIIKISNAVHQNLNNEPNFTVTGVVEKWPSNSHFTFDMLLSYETFFIGNEKQRSRWTGHFDNFTYLLLAPNSDYRELEKKFPAMIKRHLDQNIQDVGASFDLFLQPLTDIHLYSKLKGDIGYPGIIDAVAAFIGIAVMILIIGCINFMNLSTARSAGRAREIGIRKALGAHRVALAVQFMGETVVFSFISLFLALGIVELLMPLYGSIFAWEVKFENVYTPGTIAGFFTLALLVGVISGSYPALIMSAFQPLGALKGNYGKGAGKSRFRNMLVIFQFSVSITLIFATIVCFRQFEYLQNKAFGFSKAQVVAVNMVDTSIRKRIESVKAELKQHSGIAGVAFSSHYPGSSARSNLFAPQGFAYEDMQQMDAISVDADFVSTMEIELLSGRSFSAGHTTDNSRAILINEAAVLQFGWTPLTAVGKTITELNGHMIEKTIVGVVKDYHQRNLYNSIKPLYIENEPQAFYCVLIKIRPGSISETMSFLEKKWHEIDSTATCDYWFLDEFLVEKYRLIKKLGMLFAGFTCIAILIACMGLFGLAMFSAQQRTREIGIRKALGATVSDIALMLSKSFIKWVMIANIFAWPLAYWFTKDWLEDYPYRIDVGFSLYALAGLLALAIALLTVSYQAIKAARGNPVDALRYE